MILKRRKLVLRYSSPVTMWFGMLLACFAWVLHIIPFLTPLWDDNAHLGHGICVELAPIVSVADAKASSKALPSKNDVTSSDPDAIQHSSCDFCVSMSAALVPEVFAHTESALLELTAVVAPFFYRSNTYYPSDFLQPLARAPPRPILT